MSDFERPLIWIHGDNLNPQQPVLARYPQAPALWVWDEALLADWQISFKRLVFIYECLLELPVTIRRGAIAPELLQFARAHSADGIATAASPSPRFQDICQQLAAELPVEVLPAAPFVKSETGFDLKRFSRYWRTAKQSALGADQR